MEFKGRTRIFTDVSEINQSNIRKIVDAAMVTHEANAISIQKLYDIEKNQQSLGREKTIRPEIDVQATDPIASQIVDFKQGYEHGTPIFYTQRARVDAENTTVADADADDKRIATLNEMMRECKKASKDSKMARDIKICGTGYRYIAVRKKNSRYLSPFEIYTLNPLRTFIIYSNDVYCRPLVAVTYTVNKDKQTKHFGCWTENAYYEFDTETTNGVSAVANQIGRIPIVEYINNYDIMGSFEKELPLIDAYNIVTSDRVNDVCQQVQSILWLHNTKLDQEGKEKLVEGGVIQTEANADGKDAKIQYVNAPLRQSDIQTLASSLKERILESAGVPKLSEGSNSTGEAMRVTNGWHTAETQAKTSELTWREAEDATIEVCLSIIDKSNVTINGVNELRLADIDYDMHRSENYDILSRVNAFATLTNLGADISKSAMYCKITDDPLQFALDSQDNINKIRFANLNGTTEVIDVEDKTTESIQPSTVRY